MRGIGPKRPGSINAGGTGAAAAPATGPLDGGGSGNCSCGAPLKETWPLAPNNNAVAAPRATETSAKTPQTERGSFSCRASLSTPALHCPRALAGKTREREPRLAAGY
jgi:hypothetical protein